MFSILELCLWFSFIIIGTLSSFYAIRGYLKYGFYLFFPLFIASIFLSIFGLCYFVGRLFWFPLMVAIGSVSLSFTFLVTFYFFRELFGDKRRYELFQILFGISVFSVIVGVIIEKPLLLENRIKFSIWQNIGMMGNLVLLTLITLDYAVYSIRKIRKKNLSLKLLIFPGNLLIMAAVDIVLYGLMLQGLIPFYIHFIIPLISTLIIVLILRYFPSIIVLVPMEPITFQVIHKNGVLIYDYELGPINNKMLLSGALSVINNLFKKSLDEFAQLKYLFMKRYLIYVYYTEQFVLLFVDRLYSKYVQKALEKTAERIKKEFGEELKNFKADTSKFQEIEDIFKKEFYFLPQFVD